MESIGDYINAEIHMLLETFAEKECCSNLVNLKLAKT